MKYLCILLVAAGLAGCGGIGNVLGTTRVVQASNYEPDGTPKITSSDKDTVFIKCAKRIGADTSKLPFINGAYKIPMDSCMKEYGYRFSLRL